MSQAKSKTRWRTVQRLGKGDALVELEFCDATRRLNPEIPERWVVRAIRYERKGFKPQTLLTSLTDQRRFPARELVALYHERWELELGFDELKTVLLKRQEALRSKSIRGVGQELWSLGLLYNLIRLEMEKIAAEAGVPPMRISFIAALQFMQNFWLVCAAMAPARIPRRLRELREDLSQFVLPPRRTERLYPRVVKIKMSPYPKKRSKPARLNVEEGLTDNGELTGIGAKEGLHRRNYRSNTRRARRTRHHHRRRAQGHPGLVGGDRFGLSSPDSDSGGGREVPAR